MRGLAIPAARSWGPACTLISSTSCPLPRPEPERSLKPYSLVRPLLVSALRPVVLLPECLAPRLIRNLLDLPSSRLDFQVCPAGEPAHLKMGGRGGTLGQSGPLALRLCLPVLCRKPLWRGTVHIVSTWSPQGPACRPRSGQQDPCHPGVCWEGRCLGWGMGGGALWAQEQRVTLGKPLPFHGCLLTCETGDLGHSASSGSPWRVWLIHLICSSLSQTCLSPGSHLGLPWVGSEPSADRGLGKVTYFPGSWAFPSSSFLIAKVDGEAGPCRGLCYGGPV